MGQQQLILLVLATVIVGVAIIVGIRAFTENNAKANYDAMVQDLTRMANDAQAWKTKPDAFGGQGDAAVKADPDNFTGLTDLGVLGYAVDAQDCYQNSNGFYKVTAVGATGTTISAYNAQHQQSVDMVVDGTTDADLEISNPQFAGDATPITCS